VDAQLKPDTHTFFFAPSVEILFYPSVFGLSGLARVSQQFFPFARSRWTCVYMVFLRAIHG
jgi:hypothetical protein